MIKELGLELVNEVLDSIMDPCTHQCGYSVSIVDMGLIRDVSVKGCEVRIDITFTEVGCMFTHRIVTQIEDRLKSAGAEVVVITPLWAPMWTEERMSKKGARAFAKVRSDYGKIIEPSYLRESASRMDTVGGVRDEDYIARC